MSTCLIDQYVTIAHPNSKVRCNTRHVFLEKLVSPRHANNFMHDILYYKLIYIGTLTEIIVKHYPLLVFEK